MYKFKVMRHIRTPLIVMLMSFIMTLPVNALDVVMGSKGSLTFIPSDIIINAGDTVRFINKSLPPHNIIVEAHPELSRESLMFNPGESQEVVFPVAGDYKFFCGPHKNSGMVGNVHVNQKGDY